MRKINCTGSVAVDLLLLVALEDSILLAISQEYNEWIDEMTLCEATRPIQI